MSVDVRKGSAAVVCDCATCHMEVLDRLEERALATAVRSGWRQQPDGGHLCPDCQRGRCPGEAAALGRVGTTGEAVVPPAPVKKGEPVVAPDGTVIGRWAADAPAGTPARIDCVVPPAGKQVGGGARSCLQGRTAPRVDDMARRLERGGGGCDGPGSLN